MKHRCRLLFSVATMVLFIAALASSQAAELVAHYEFEDPNDLGHDSSGNDNHAETVESVNQVEGQFGQGAFFDEGEGSNFYKSDGLTGFTGKPGVTLAAWVKLDEATTGFDGIISQDSGACCDNRILLHSGTHKPFINLSEHADRHLDAGPEFLVDEWTHIAMTGQDGDGVSEARVYVNGVEIEGSPQEFPEMDDGSEWNTYLGVGESGTAHRLTGTLDDVRIYQGALTAEEVEALLIPDDSNPSITLNQDQALNGGTLPALTTAQELRFPVRNTVKPDDERGAEVLTINVLEITGGDTDNFTLISAPTSIDPGGSEDIVLSFDNKGGFGAFSVTLNAQSNDPDPEDQDITFTIRATVINPVGPIAHYRLDETDVAGVVADATGLGGEGIFQGAVVLAETGLKEGTGTAAKFTGGSNVSVDSLSGSLSDSFTVALWLNPASLGDIASNDFRTVFAKGQDNPVFGLLEGSGEFVWFGDDGNGNAIGLFNTEGFNLQSGNTYHVAMRYDGATGMGTFLVDGADVGSAEVAPFDDLGTFYIGAFNSALPFDGTLDDVQVYDLALTEDDIAFLIANPGKPLVPVGEVDTDLDGLTDDSESNTHMTDPLKADTDGDGLNDGQEVNDTKTDPLLVDTDGDGGSDGTELIFGADPLDPDNKLGEFLVRTIKAGNGIEFASMEAFKEALQDQSQIAEEVAENATFINFRDNAQGHFANDELPFALWEDVGARDDFGIHVTGKINVTEAGVRTFGMNSDDGNQLFIDGMLVAEDPAPHGSQDIFGSIDLTEGEHDLEMFFYERGGGAQVELFVNTELGEVETFDDGRFVLLPGFGTPSADSDGDGLSDFFENGFFGNLEMGADDDGDGDGLSNLGEQEAGTNPTVADTDGDSVNDGDEVADATNPTNADTDGDGLADGDEKARGTDATNRDTDGDKFSDAFEVANGSDPLDPDSPGNQVGGPIVARVDAGKLTSVDQLFITGAFTHAVNVGETGEDVMVGDINFVRDTPGSDNIEIDAVNHIEDWGAANDFGEDDDNVNLAKVASGIRWSGQPDGVVVTLKDVDRGAHRLQLIFGEKCCDRGFAVKVNDETILDAFSPNALQEGDQGGASAAYVIYEFNQLEVGDVVIDLNGTDAGFPDGNAILSGVSLQFLQSIDGDPGAQRSPAILTVVAGTDSYMLSLAGEADKTYDIEYSPDLLDWTVIMSGLSGDINVEDTDAARVGLAEGYYRGVEN